MSDPRLLLVESGPSQAAGLNDAQLQSLYVDVSTSIGDALKKVSERSYDAILCWAETQDQLYGVVRIRKAQPEIPIVAATPADDSAFVEWARRLGATRAYRKADLPTTVEKVCQALRTGELALETLAQAQESHNRAREVHTLARETKSLVRDARNEQRKSSGLQFLPLVVEDDPNEALLLLRAFEKADIFAPLPILRTAEEAIEYLQGGWEFSDRNRFPLPSIVLLDLQLPRKSGFAVLDWIRSRPEFRRLKVVILSASILPEDINRAYESKADAFFTKPTSFTAFVELIASLERHWSTPRIEPEA